MAKLTTQEIAQKRVAIKRALRIKGVTVKANMPTKLLQKMYKDLYPGKNYPKYKK